ncbi:MAG: hypothetical protein ACFFC5_05080 [Promethearchaeota archaeon]
MARRGRSSERIARYILENFLGFEITEVSRVVIVDGIEAAEVDIIAKNSVGQPFAVEVKAGMCDVSTLRQAYANAKMLGPEYLPMVICKGFSDEAAEKVSKELGVAVIQLKDLFVLLGPEELEIIIQGVMREVLDEYGLRPIVGRDMLDKEDLRILTALTNAETLSEAAQTSETDEMALVRVLSKLRKGGILPKTEKNFQELKIHISRILKSLESDTQLESIQEGISRLLRKVEDIEERIVKLTEKKSNEE